MTRLHKNKRVLIYLDSTAFGGHEVTLLEAVKGLAQEPGISLSLLVPRSGRKLLKQLRVLEGSVKIIEHAFQTAPGDVFQVLFRTGKVRRLQKIMLQQKPDMVIVSQGAIALSACGLGAARSAHIPLMSFLPMAHPVALVREKNSISVRIQELLYQRLYALPDYFFTICQTAKQQLQQLHGIDPARIFVHYFGLKIDSGLQDEPSRQGEARREKHIALIGRIEFQQKRHDFFMRHFAACRTELPALTVHIIGDGPDRDKLQSLVRELNLQDAVKFEGWADNMPDWYKKLDAVLLPSRFEGVPVVMLEAMQWGIPVIASNTDGMAEMLPKEWLFPVGDGGIMMQCIQDMFANNQREHLLKNRQFVDTLDIASFRAGFRNAVLKCLEENQQQGKNP